MSSIQWYICVILILVCLMIKYYNPLSLLCILDPIKFTRRNKERCFYVKICGWIILIVAIAHTVK